jgi:hypothetical protein
LEKNATLKLHTPFKYFIEALKYFMNVDLKSPSPPKRMREKSEEKKKMFVAGGENERSLEMRKSFCMHQQ